MSTVESQKLLEIAKRIEELRRIEGELKQKLLETRGSVN